MISVFLLCLFVAVILIAVVKLAVWFIRFLLSLVIPALGITIGLFILWIVLF